ncbi:hypothetical protein OG539_02790 [Actinacidiphila glaucinigra]|uniref:hypothetical protein n=1 Tax=Actinacidiphila glaucinigra TaxID=235986 RepID=UPI002DDA2137|nr:hypothetical protein [Actinacidiphila glaucinigra]WSD64658.1 hypothetical protein OIE69_40065 [Actinacidiphila glaucinigra]
MMWRVGRRVSPRGVLLLLGMLVLTGIHLLACAHGPDRAGNDTLAAAPSDPSLCRPGGGAALPDQDLARGNRPQDDHHALCGVALDRLPDPRPRWADAPAAPGVEGAPRAPAPAIHPARAAPGGAGHPCAPARSGPATLSLLCVSRT